MPDISHQCKKTCCTGVRQLSLVDMIGTTNWCRRSASLVLATCGPAEQNEQLMELKTQQD